MKTFLLLLLSTSLFLFGGCVTQIAVSTVGGIVDNGFDAITEEQDLDFAAQALPGTLKLLEVMLKNDPSNKRLLRLLAEGYNSYALGFVEDTDPVRAKVFYLRATEYATTLLRQDDRFARALDGSVDDLKTELARCGKEDVPGIFWAAFGMGSYMYLSLDNPDAIALLPKAEAMMTFVARVDSSFYYGGADMFLGTLFGSRPRMMGGDPDRARAHFERALRINGGTFLMTHVYFARSYAVQTLNEELFDQLLETVDKTSLDTLPRFRLGNAIAKKKAALLRAKRADLF
jgi:hypothetical protein